MAWHQTGTKPLPETMMSQITAKYVEQSLNELWPSDMLANIIVSGNVLYSVAYRYRKSISIIELFVSIISIYIGFLAPNF